MIVFSVRHQHRYLAFRLRHAQAVLLELARSAQYSAIYILLIGAPIFLSALALFDFPLLYAPLLPPLAGLAVVFGYTALLSLPLILMRKRLLPLEILQWRAALPISPRLAQIAHLAVSGLVLLPLLLACAISFLAWLWLWPRWLPSVLLPAGLLIVFALLASWALGAYVLQHRCRTFQPQASGRSVAVPSSYTYHAAPWRLAAIWHNLFWRPFWRQENALGWQQSALFLLSAACFLIWTLLGLPSFFPRELLGLFASSLLMIQTDRGDKAVQAQWQALTPLLAAWPLQTRRLYLLAKLFALLPAFSTLLFMLLLWQQQAKYLWVANMYCAFGLCASVLLVLLPAGHARLRVGWLVVAILILTAMGSEIW